MLTLLNECHFWTTQSEIQIKSTDFGSYKYLDKKDNDRKSVLIQSKNDYNERRGGRVSLSNRKPTRLKDSLKKLEELLSSFKISHLEWRDASVVQLLLSNGMLVYISLNIYTGDIVKMAFDKYFVGKLASDAVNDAIFTRQHIIISYNTNQITMVYLQKPNMRRAFPEKISNMDPRVFHILIPSASERRLARNLSVNSSFDLVTVWTKSSLKEIYPWKPTIRDLNRANVQIYKIRATKLETLACCWTENDPLCVEFLKTGDGRVVTVEEKISKKGEVTAEVCFYEVGQMKMLRIGVTSISVGAKISCHSFSPDQEKLFLGTIDRNVYVFDFGLKTIKFTPKTEIIPIRSAWHPDSTVVYISNDRSQFQCFDLSLSCIGNQTISEDIVPNLLHDISHYFTEQKRLLKMCFSCKPHGNHYSSSYIHTPTDCFLLIAYENGPIGCLRLLAGIGLSRDVQSGSGLTGDILVSKYLAINQFEKAVNILLSLNWETSGTICLIALHKMSNYIFTRHDIIRSRNELFYLALQSFPQARSESLDNEFGDQIVDLKRRYFFFLLKNKLYSDAFDVAKAVEDYDLFMDLFNTTKHDCKLLNFAQESFRQAETILRNSNENDANTSVSETHSISNCSRLSCNDCLPQSKPDKVHSKPNRIDSVKIPKLSQSYLTIRRNPKSSDQCNRRELTAETYVPPLPYTKSKIFSAENVKINTPKQERKPIVHSNMFKPLTARSHSMIDFKYSRNSGETSSIRIANNRSSSTQREYKFTIKQDENNKYQVVDLLSTSECKKQSELQKTEMWSHVPDQTIGIPVNNSNQAAPIASSGISAFAPIHNAQSASRLRYGPSGNNNMTSPPPYPHTAYPSVNVPTRLQPPKPNANYINIYPNDDTCGLPQRSLPFDGAHMELSRSSIPPIPAARNGFRTYLTSAQKDPPESLPTYRYDGEYLREMNHMATTDTTIDQNCNDDSKEECETKSGIKVVHFGVV